MIYLILSWLILTWGYSSAFIRPFDDFKNCFYIPAAALILYFLQKSQWDKPLRINVLSLSVFGYFVVALISIVNSHAQYEGCLEFTRLFIWCGLVWVFAHLSFVQMRRLGMASVISSATIGLLTALGLRGIPILPTLPASFLSPIGHISYFSDFLALHMPLSVYFLITARNFKIKALWAISGALIMTGVLLSGTRASEVGLLVGAGVFFVTLILRGKVYWKPIIAGFVGFVGLVSLLIFIQPYGIRGKIVERLSTMAPTIDNFKREITNRKYAVTLKMIREQPIKGVGLGNYRFELPRYLDDPTLLGTWYYHPHNETLQQAAEVGLPGLVLMLVGIGALFWYGIRFLRNKWIFERYHELVILGMTGVSIALIFWQFDTAFLHPLIRVMVAFYAALIWKYAVPQAKGKLIFGLIQPTLSILTVAAMFFIGTYQASIYCVKKSWKYHDYVSAKVWATIAKDLAPGAFDPLLSYNSLNALVGQPDEESLSLLRSQFPNVPAVKQFDKHGK